MKALTVINIGRYQVLSPVLDRLIDRDVIKSWLAISLEFKKNMSGYVSGKHNRNVLFIEDQFFNSEKDAKQYLAGLGQKYVNFDFGQILAAEKHVSTYFPGGIVDIASMIKTVDDTITYESPDLFIGDIPASALDMTAYQLCKSKEIPTIYINLSRIDDRIFFCFEPDKGIKELITYYYYLYKKTGIKRDQSDKAEEFLQNFKKHKIKPSYFTNFSKNSVQKGNGRIHRIKSAANQCLTNPFLMAGKFNRKIRALGYNQKLSRTFSQIDKEDKIIFFPVQYQPEASTLIRSPYYKNQYALIENLCICVPPDYTVYVKEHIQHIHQKRLPPSFYRDFLQRFPNLKFMDVSLDSHDLINSSKLVVVLSSTAGWEAFLYGVPVLQLGVSFYSIFKGVYRCGSYQSMKAQINDILKNHRPDNKEKLTAIAATFKGTFEGNFDDPAWDPTVLRAQNMKNITDTVVKGIKFYPKWQAFMRSRSGTVCEPALEK